MLISNNQNTNLKKDPSFGSAALATGVMNYLATNEAIGATAVDMGAMVIPRTAIDFTRTPEAGVETFRREIVSCVLYAVLGVFGLGAAMAIAPMVAAKKYGVPLPKITAGSDSLDVMAHSWNKALGKHGKDLSDKEKVIDTYLNEVVGAIQGVDGDKRISIDSNPNARKEIVDELKKHLLDEQKGFVLDKEQKHKLIQKIINAAGSAENLQLKLHDKELNIGAADLLDNVYTLGRSFMSEKVANEFKSTENIADNNFLKDLKKFNSKKMMLGLGAASVVAISMQAVNRWMTKKKTGSDGFVAYKGKKAEKDNSTGFKAMKALSAAAIGAFSLKTIAGKDAWKTIPKKLEFTKIMPNLAQYKLVYGITIMGRFLAAGDKNELRESVTRDFLGFTSWLILGDMAARAMAKSFEKIPGVSLLNHKNGKPSGTWQALMDSSMKTHEEIIYGKGQNTVGKSFGDAAKSVTKNAEKSLKYRNIAQIGGYVVSGLLLGIGIPMLNKVVTNKIEEGKNKNERPAPNPPVAQTSQPKPQIKQNLT